MCIAETDFGKFHFDIIRPGFDSERLNTIERADRTRGCLSNDFTIRNRCHASPRYYDGTDAGASIHPFLNRDVSMH